MSYAKEFWDGIDTLMARHDLWGKNIFATGAVYDPARLLPDILNHPDEDLRKLAGYEMAKAELGCRTQKDETPKTGDAAVVKLVSVALGLTAALHTVAEQIATGSTVDPADPLFRKVDTLSYLRLREAAILRVLIALRNDPRTTTSDKRVLSVLF